MDYATISTFIQTVGFPAVCVLGMGYFVKYITDQHHEEIEKMNEQHRAEMQEVTRALNNNTVALERLTVYFELEKGTDHVEGN